MQNWKNVLNGLLVVGAVAGMFFYIDYATEPQNQPLSHEEDRKFSLPRASGRGPVLSVATPPALPAPTEENISEL